MPAGLPDPLPLAPPTSLDPAPLQATTPTPVPAAADGTDGDWRWVWEVVPLDPTATDDPSDWWARDVPLDPTADGGFGDSSEPDLETPRTGPDELQPLPFGLDKLDADRDIQVTLYEWRTGFEARGVRTADVAATYVLLDLNNNNFLDGAELDAATGRLLPASERSDLQNTAFAALTALLNTAAGGNTPAGTVATLPSHADDPKPVAGGTGGAGIGATTDPAWQVKYGQQLRDYQAAMQVWVNDFYPRYRRQWTLEHRATVMMSGFETNAQFAADNVALAQSVGDFLADVEMWSVADPNDGPANRDTSPIRTWGGYITNVMSSAELDRAEAKLTTLQADYQSAWDAYRLFLRARGVIEVTGYVDPTPVSSWVDGAFELVEGNWQAGLVTIFVGSVPFVGGRVVRWVRGGRTAGAVAHAEPGLIATVPGLPRQGGLNLHEPPVLGRPHFDPALGNRPPVVATRPKPAPHEQPVPVGSADKPPLPKPEPTPTGGGGTGGGAGPTAPPPGGGKPNPYRNLTREQLESSKASLEKLIKDHEKKIADFRKDPIGNSTPEWLAQATRDNPTAEVLLQRAMGRITQLEAQLRKQRGELEKIIDALSRL